MLAVAVACGALGWLTSLDSLAPREGGGYTLAQDVAAGATVLSVKEGDYLHPTAYAEGIGAVDALVKTLHQAAKDDSTVRRWVGSYPTLDKSGVLKKLILDKRNTKPIPAHAANVYRNFRNRVEKDFAALMERRGASMNVPRADYIELRDFVAAHSWSLNGGPLVVPTLHPLDFVGVEVRYNPEDASVNFIATKDYRAGDVLGAPVADTVSVPHKIFRYRSLAEADLDHDCYPVNLRDRWGGKTADVDIPSEACLKKGEVPEALLRSFALGTMSDAKIAKGCAALPTISELFLCVGTADFEQRVYKKAALFFKNEMGKHLGDAGSKAAKEFDTEVAKLANDPLTPFVKSQRAVLEALVAEFTHRSENVDASVYKGIAEKRTKEEKKDKKDKTSSANEEDAPENTDDDDDEPKKSSKKKDKKKGGKKDKKKKAKKSKKSKADDE